MATRNVLRVLTPGDRVDLVAPASACGAPELERGAAVLRSWGLEPRVPPDLFGRPYIYANDDAIRWRQLRRALAASDSRAVWCVRGGYGSARLLPRLHRARRLPPKLFVGFSDISALHAFLVQQWGWVGLHAPVVAQLGGELSRAAAAELQRIVLGRQCSLAYEGLEALNPAARRRGRLAGRLVGGNLKTLQSLLGTPWALRTASRLLVIEDVRERGYALDRMLVQLRQAGALRGLRALLLGTFTGGREPDGSDRTREVLAAFANEVSFPVLAGMPIGHGPGARPLPLGMSGQLELGPRARLAVDWELSREPG